MCCGEQGNEEPGNELEGMPGPAPAVPPGASHLMHLLRVLFNHLSLSLSLLVIRIAEREDKLCYPLMCAVSKTSLED